MAPSHVVQEIQTKLKKLADPETAKTLKRFFKTGAGEYGEGDIILGIRVPELRKIAKDYSQISLEEIEQLLRSPFHEERFLALLFLVGAYSNGNASAKRAIYTLYMANTQYINNWDLVDGSAVHIVGPFLFDKSLKPLYTLARSRFLWERRIAVMSTFYFIRQGHYSETLKIARMLLSDTEDLIHKSVGWMLREVGKRDLEAEEVFLRAHYRKMPRTMLRYAIEKIPEPKRKQYLKGKVR